MASMPQAPAPAPDALAVSDRGAFAARASSAGWRTWAGWAGAVLLGAVLLVATAAKAVDPDALAEHRGHARQYE